MISIIIPVYNTADDMLKQCVNSILATKNVDFEILIVDDGSAKETATTIDRIAELDSRIIAFHKPNGGVSSARNFGLSKANGEYIAFVDGDDVLEQGFFEKAISLINECDLVVGKVNWFSNKEIHKSNYDNRNDSSDLSRYYFPNDKETVVRAFMNWPDNDEEFYKGFQAEVWGKLYKKELMQDLRFNEKLPIGEDTLFFLEYLLRCNSLIIVNSVFYNYRLNDESAMWKYDSKRVEKYKAYIDATIDVYSKYGLQNDLAIKVYYEIKELQSCFYGANHQEYQFYKNAQSAVRDIYRDDKIKKILKNISLDSPIPAYSYLLLRNGMNCFCVELLRRRLVSLIRR